MRVLLNKWNNKAGTSKDDCGKANQEKKRDYWNESEL